MSIFQCCSEGILVIKIGLSWSVSAARTTNKSLTDLEESDTSFRQYSCGRLCWVSSNAADFELLRKTWVFQNRVDYGTSLIASDTEHHKNLLNGHTYD